MMVQGGSDRRTPVCNAVPGAKGACHVVCQVVPSAKDVYLAGDFNGWDPTATRMTRTRNGSFRASVQLSPGEHQYRLVVDGQWVTDQDAERQVPNSFGTCNSVIKVV